MAQSPSTPPPAAKPPSAATPPPYSPESPLSRTPESAAAPKPRVGTPMPSRDPAEQRALNDLFAAAESADDSSEIAAPEFLEDAETIAALDEAVKKNQNKEIKELKKEIENLNKEVEDLDKEVEGLNKELEELKTENSELRGERDSYKSQSEDIYKALGDTKGGTILKKVENLVEQLKSVKKDLDKEKLASGILELELVQFKAKLAKIKIITKDLEGDTVLEKVKNLQAELKKFKVSPPPPPALETAPESKVEPPRAPEPELTSCAPPPPPALSWFSILGMFLFFLLGALAKDFLASRIFLLSTKK